MVRKIIIRGEIKMTYNTMGKLVLYDKKIHGLSDEHRAKISAAHEGRKHTKESRENMSKGKTLAWKSDPRKITDEKKKHIIRLRLNKNMTPTEIGEMLGIDRKMISKILRQAGISSQKQSKTN